MFSRLPLLVSMLHDFEKRPDVDDLDLDFKEEIEKSNPLHSVSANKYSKYILCQIETTLYT